MATNPAIILPKRVQDVRGLTFGRWRVLEYDPASEGSRKHRWICICECGNQKSVPWRDMQRGKSKSCGCLRVELTGARFSKGASDSWASRKSEYFIYHAMLQRCYNRNRKDYPRYGGRGISVCDRWRIGEAGRDGFSCFYDDMGARPPGLSIDRIENDGNYEPGNCRWATAVQQAGNRRQR